MLEAFAMITPLHDLCVKALVRGMIMLKLMVDKHACCV